jgi:hypothetical protein
LVLTQTEKRKWKKSYSLEYFKAGQLEGEDGPYLSFAAVVVGGKEPRKPIIKLYSDEISAGAGTKVSCTCPYFKIKLALPLYTSGSTEVIVRRRDIPEKYRGIQKPGLCPHLMKLAEVVLAQDSTEIDRVRESSRRININDKLKRLT